MVRWEIRGSDRAAWRVIPHVAHYTESWHYDNPTGDLISYSADYQHYVNPKYADRKFPEGLELQRWKYIHGKPGCRCHLCKARESK